MGRRSSWPLSATTSPQHGLAYLIFDLGGEDAVLEWVRSTGLRPVLEALAQDERQRFLDRYRAALLEAYPPRPDGLLRRVYANTFLNGDAPSTPTSFWSSPAWL